MHTALFRAIFALSIATCCVATAGCHVDELNVNVDDAKINADVDTDVDVNNVRQGDTIPIHMNVDVNNVRQGDTIPIHMNVENVYLVDPSQDPPADHVKDAGHIQIYLDDFDSDPLLVTAQVDVQVKISESVELGEHTLKCRVHKHDGSATNAVFEIKITVKAKASSGG